MRLLKHYHHTSRGGIALSGRSLLALVASLAIIVGGVLTYEGIHNSPKQVIHRLIIKDHQRAEKLANAKPSSNTSTLVPWKPTRVDDA